MGIGMKKAETHKLFEVTGGTDFRNGRWIDAGVDQARSVVDFDSREVIEA